MVSLENKAACKTSGLPDIAAKRSALLVMLFEPGGDTLAAHLLLNGLIRTKFDIKKLPMLP